MKSKLLLSLALVLSGGLLGCSAIAENPTNSNQWRGFEILPPITNVNPSIRLPLLVHVPTKLKIERASDTLSVEIDKSSLEATNLMVGTNMVTGVASRVYVYPDGEPRPANGGYGLGGTDFNLGTRFWHAKPDGIPLPGKKYVVEVELAVFETDIPPQHDWSPQGSKNYKILWQRILKQAVLDTPTFLQNTFKTIEQRVPELGSIGMTAGIPSSGQGWHGEEYASGTFVLQKNIRYHPAGEFPRATTPVPYADIFVTITRYASVGDAQLDLKNSLFLRPATFKPKESYKGATLYRYEGASGGVMTAICQSGLYIVEINPNSEGARPLTMKVLDAVLAELDSTSSKSN